MAGDRGDDGDGAIEQLAELGPAVERLRGLLQAAAAIEVIATVEVPTHAGDGGGSDGPSLLASMFGVVGEDVDRRAGHRPSVETEGLEPAGGEA